MAVDMGGDSSNPSNITRRAEKWVANTSDGEPVIYNMGMVYIADTPTMDTETNGGVLIGNR